MNSLESLENAQQVYGVLHTISWDFVKSLHGLGLPWWLR